VKKEDAYDLNCIDHRTKYITAHLVVEERTKNKCIEFLSQIKKTRYDQILEIYHTEKTSRKEKENLSLLSAINLETTK